MQQTLRFLIIFICFSVFETIQAKINVGVKGGLTFMNETSTPFLLSESSSLDIFTQHGTEVGALIEGQIATSRWFYDAGVSFTRKGSKYEATASDNVAINEAGYNRINYLEVPLSLKYKLPINTQPIKFYAAAGMSFALAISGNIDAKQQQDASTFHLKEKITFGNGKNDLFKKYDCGINLGIGIEMVEKIQIGCLYNLGLIDLYNENYQGVFHVRESIKNRGWNLFLTVLF